MISKVKEETKESKAAKIPRGMADKRTLSTKVMARQVKNAVHASHRLSAETVRVRCDASRITDILSSRLKQHVNKPLVRDLWAVEPASGVVVHAKSKYKPIT